jgi:hypothetical protein
MEQKSVMQGPKTAWPEADAANSAPLLNIAAMALNREAKSVTGEWRMLRTTALQPASSSSGRLLTFRLKDPQPYLATRLFTLSVRSF